MKQTKQGLILAAPDGGITFLNNSKLFVRQVGDLIEVWELKGKFKILEVVRDATKEAAKREASENERSNISIRS